MRKFNMRKPRMPFLRNRFVPFGLILVIMSIQLIALVVASNWQKIDVYNDRVNAEIDKCITDIENVAERAKEVMMHMNLDNEILWAVQQQELTPMEQQRLLLNLKAYKNFSKEIKNIYIFTEKNDCIYSSVLPCKKLAEFPFAKTRKLLQDGYNADKVLVISDKAEGMTELYGGEVVRFMLKFDGVSSFVVMVDIDTDVINSVFRPFEKNFNGTVYIEFSENEFIYIGNGQGLLPASLRDVEIEEKRAMRSYDGERHLVIHKMSNQFDAHVFGVISENRIKADGFTTRAFVVINISIIFLGFLLGAVGLLFKFLRDNNKKHAMELEKLKNNDVRENFLKEHQPVIKCFKGANDEEIENCKKHIESLFELGESDKIAFVRVDFHYLNDEDMAACGKYSLMKQVESVFKQNVAAFAVYEQDDYVLFLLGKVEVDYIARCRKSYYDCRKILLERGMEVSCYVSDTTKVENISDIYFEVSSLAEYMFIYNRPIFVDYSLVLQRALESDNWVENEILGIKNNILIPNEETSLLLENFINNLRRLGIKEVKQAIYALYLAIDQCVERIQSENKKFNFDLVQYFSRISLAKSLDEVRNLFIEIIEQIQRHSVDVENEIGKYELIIKRAYAVIEQNLSNVSLCRTMIAEELGVSKSHLSRVFKETAGISLSDLINDLRLKATAELLVSTNKSIKEIINEVGIVNQSYFTVMFKKRYGLSPSEYRNKKSNQ